MSRANGHGQFRRQSSAGWKLSRGGQYPLTDRLSPLLDARQHLRPANMLPGGLQGPQLELGALGDQGPLKVRHGHQDVHLKPSCRVRLPRVDALAGNEQGDAIRLKLTNHLSQVRQGATKPIQLVAHDQVDFLAPDQFHQSIQALPGKGHPRDCVLDLLNDCPAVTLAISAQGVKLLTDRLFVGGDSCVEGDFHYMDTTQRVTNRKPVSFKNCPVFERGF